MFDTLLNFTNQNIISLFDIYLQNQKDTQKIMAILKDRNSATIKLFDPDKLPEDYKEQKKEYEQKRKELEQIQDLKVTFKDKWIIPLPIIHNNDLKILKEKKYWDTPYWYIILDDEKKQVLFTGIPQEKENGIQYILVAENTELMIAKHHWKDELTTLGQKYLGTCQSASRNMLNYYVFRSDRKIHDMIIKYSTEECEKIFKFLYDKDSSLLNKLEQINLIDKIGSPVTPVIYNKIRFANDTVRHILLVDILKSIYGRMKDWKICEIGGSYGSLCYILSLMTNFQSYDFIEIPYCLDLAEKVLTELKVTKVNYRDTLNIDGKPDNKKYCYDKIEDIDLLIGEYILDDIVEEKLIEYEKILKISKNAIFVVNDVTLCMSKLSKYFNSVETYNVLERDFLICKRD
jgi:hypothetical protein